MNSAPLVFMFSGQGSHYFQMGRALFDQHPKFRESMLAMDVMVRDLSGASVVDSLYESGRSKSEVFDRTLLTHPAIFMVECALAQALISEGIYPQLTLGASLGTFAAAVIGECISLEDALCAVVRQAQSFEAHCEPGGMIAVLAEPALYQEEFLAATSALAGINFESHFVISTPKQRLAQIEQELRKRDIRYQRLPVSFAFHSQWIDSAAAPFEALTRSIRFRKSTTPFVCCAGATTLEELPPNHLWNIVRHPILFRQAIDRIERAVAYRYIDLGPAGTLATFLKYTLSPRSASSIHTVMTPFNRDVENFRALLELGPSSRSLVDANSRDIGHTH